MIPDISFVVPVFNKQSYIAETLNGLQNQTHRNIEVIVVDDKSEDNSVKIINHYLRDKRFSLVELPTNKGRSHARNFGNTIAKSNIIAVNDADDISHRERAKEILKGFDKNIDVFYSGFMVADKDAKVEKIMPGIPINKKKIIKDGCTYIGHSTMAYKKGIVKKFQYSEGQWSKLGLDDWKLQMDMIKAGCVWGFTEDALVIYRDFKNGVVHTRDNNEVSRIKKEYLRGIR